MNRLPCVALLCLILGSHAKAAEEARESDESTGTIVHVTLYRDRALVTREIPVPAGKNLRSITVPDLPEQVVVDSLFAEGNDQTVVRAVRVSARPVIESQRKEVRELDQQITQLTQQQADAKQASNVVAEDIKVLSQMVSFSTSAGRGDLNRGVLDAKTLSELTTYSMKTRRELATEQYQQQKKLKELETQLRLLQQKRSLAASGKQVTIYQAKVFLETVKGAAGMVRLNYLVRGCGWSPQYTIRGGIAKPKVELQYSGLVQQMSGENWVGVKLALSTASPSVNAARPVLTPLNIVSVKYSASGDHLDDSVPGDHPFGHGNKGRDQSGSAPTAGADPFGNSGPVGPRSSQGTGSNGESALAKMLRALRDQQRVAELSFDNGGAMNVNDSRDEALNSLADQMQQIELQAESKSWRMLAADVNGNVASQIYELSQPVSLDTRREQQLVQIREGELDGEMYHVATPLLSTYAYREAEITNTLEIGLLGGPATIYLDDRFVGRTKIPSTAAGQKLTIGFGADQQVRTRRELLSKTENANAGNRQLTFSYRLVLANFKDQPVKIRLFDRLPVARQEEQLSVKMDDDTKKPLSEDGLYNRLQRPSGILRWDIDLPKETHGTKAFDVHYNYTLEFDRSRMPTSRHSLAELQAEFDQLSKPFGAGGGMGGMGGFGGGGGE